MRRLTATLAAFVLLVLVCPSARASEQCPGDDSVPTADTAGQAALSLVCDMNALRAQRALPPLSWDLRLWKAAQGMADAMAGRHFFSHTTPDGRTLLDRVAPTAYTRVSDDWLLLENLGWGSGSLSSPLEMSKGWMNSEQHRLDMMDPKIRDVGMGIAWGSPTPNGANGWFYVADFGSRGTFALAARHRVCITPAAHSARKAFPAVCKRRSL